MLPHLEGAQFPESVPGARGVFFGVALHHGRGHFVRAILEAVACLIARDVAALRAAAIPVQSIVSLGGGARSDVWLQIKADVCGLPVATLESEEAALLGAAMLAGVGAGCFADLPAAVRAMSRPGRQFLPNAEHRTTYDRTLATYTALHARLMDLF